MTDAIPPPVIDLTEGAPPAAAERGIAKAVAIEYVRGRDDAPRVTASGKGAVAEQILQIAFAQGIKVREDAELVEILSLIEVDSLIPIEAFAAVAEILTYVYEANASYRQRRNPL
jgi:flagellar biosynthesis protein